MLTQKLNRQLSTHHNRVVVHPKCRSIGLGAKLILEMLPLAGMPYVEMLAVMEDSPFAEKADMRKIGEQQAVKSVSAVSEVLLDLGFDLQLLGSERYVTSKLANLTAQQFERLKGRLLSVCILGLRKSLQSADTDLSEKQAIFQDTDGSK